MGNLQKIALLARKNLRQRLSNRCLFFCELVAPLILVGLVGFYASFNSNRRHHYVPSSDEELPDAHDENFHREQHFSWEALQNRSTHNWTIYYDYPPLPISCWYLTDQSVSSELAKSLSAHLEETNDEKIHWKRTWMTERAIEVCMAQKDSNCSDIVAVVIFTQFEDNVKEKNQSSLAYKIRVHDLDDIYYEDTRISRSFIVDLRNYETMDILDYAWETYFYKRAFAYIQRKVDQSFKNYLRTNHRNFSTDNSTELKISMVRMPYVDSSMRPHRLSIAFGITACLAIFSLMRVNIEKSSGFKELLRMHGVSLEIQWMAWWISNFGLYACWTLGIMALMWLPIGGGYNILPETDINGLSFWMIHFLLMMTVTTTCGFVSTFFEKTWTAASAGLVVWIGGTVSSGGFYGALNPETLLGSYCVFLNPLVALDFSFSYLIDLDIFSQPKSPWRVPVTPLECLIMILVDNCILMALTIYFDNVLKSKYGVTRSPFYWVRYVQNALLKLMHKNKPYHTPYNNANCLEIVDMKKTAFESDPEYGEVCIFIENLKKRYQRQGQWAVNNLTTKLFQGEIYALLGFNGAGKTTTINVLSGLTSPSSGTARIFDYDIENDMESIRKYIGLCPQHNLLYEEMSILEQVSFFAELKGISNSKDMASDLLNSLGMSEKAHCKPQQLSGGQKRRAHLAIALVGNTKVAFLDEPTSGLDLETRRGIWETISQLRGSTTILLTTHDMEEADFLADRIGIMSDGKLICNGTPSFLKKHYGVGYSLKMNSFGADDTAQRVETLAKQFLPAANLMLENSDPQTVNLSIPTHGLDLIKMTTLMETLRDNQASLGVSNIGLSISTMNDVFLKIGNMVHAGVVLPHAQSYRCNLRSERAVGITFDWRRFHVLIKKRMWYFLHAPFTLFLQIFTFSALLWLSHYSMATAPLREHSIKVDVPLDVTSLASYNVPTIVMENSSNNTMADSYLQHAKNQADSGKILVQKIAPGGMTQFLTDSAFKTIQSDENLILVGASFNSSKEVNGYFSPNAPHSASLSMNLISRAEIGADLQIDATINVTSHPFASAHRFPNYGILQSYHRRNPSIILGSTILLVLIESLLVGVATLLPTEERLNHCKHLQLMSGTSPFLYWTSLFTLDFIFFSAVNVITVGVLVLVDYTSGYWMFTCYNAGLVMFCILECFVFAALWFCYLISWAPCIKTPSDGFLIVCKVAVSIGIFWCLLRNPLLNLSSSYGNPSRSSTFSRFMYAITKSTEYIFWIVPMHTLFTSIAKLETISVPNSICFWYPSGFLDLVCEDEMAHEKTDFLYSCCKSCKKNCFTPRAYLTTENLQVDGLDIAETFGLVFDVLGQLACGILCALILFSLEYFRPYQRSKKRQTPSSNAPAATEQNGGSDPSFAVRDENCNLRVNSLDVDFGKVKAVKGLSFSVTRGECFGLLGVNGAGKTSTFRVLTGELLPTRGDIFSNKLNLYKERSEYLASLGYCPQFDGLIGKLTGLQMVELFGSLRGISDEYVKEEAKIWLDKFGLLGSCNKICSSYSGGMKRRLSTAIALIGNPKVVLLDEPTTGVDPAYRRQFLRVIRDAQTAGQSVILTSHSMDECESLCSRIGIMVDGKFKCSGNVQELKCKYGEGLILKLRLKPVRPEDEPEKDLKIDRLSRRILSEFQSSRVTNKRKGLLEYLIMDKSLWYSDVFRKMEEIRGFSPEEFEVVQEYSVTETSLQDVFLSFVGNTSQP